MKHLLTFLFFLTVFALASTAQVCSDENTWGLLDYDIMESGVLLNSNLTIIKQTGTQNNIVTIQQNPGVSANQILSNQHGARNVGYINQMGESHQTSLRQSGNRNEANLWSSGNLANTSVIQKGNGNFINSYIDNKVAQLHSASLVQHGRSNSIELALMGNSLSTDLDCTVSVVQTGNANMAELILDHFDAPYLKVEQTGGAVITITHSAFSFPMK